MSRDIAAALLAKMAAGTFEPLFLAEFEFDSGSLYVWNGIGPKTLDSKTYTGTGSLLSFSQAEETSEVISRGMDIVLTGIPSSMIALALAEPWQGRSCVVRLGAADITETMILFSGKLDQMNIDESASTSMITVNVENELAALDRTVDRLYSNASQQSRYPNDKAFEFVVQTKREFNWGGPSNNGFLNDVVNIATIESQK